MPLPWRILPHANVSIAVPIVETALHATLDRPALKSDGYIAESVPAPAATASVQAVASQFYQLAGSAFSAAVKARHRAEVCFNSSAI